MQEHFPLCSFCCEGVISGGRAGDAWQQAWFFSGPLGLRHIASPQECGRLAGKRAETKLGDLRTDTVPPIGSQHKTRLADTFEAAVLVDTHPVETHVGRGTFIVIWGGQTENMS